MEKKKPAAAAAAASSAVAAKKAFLASVKITAHSVIGTRQTKDGLVKAPDRLLPDKNCAFCDPAGLQYIKSGKTGGAGGASGQIYQFLNIFKFPDDVKKNVTKECDARFHNYTKYAVIHVVGPDFRVRNPGKKAGIKELSKAYTNVFKAAIKASGKINALRLLPISGGIFSGELGDTPKKMADLTVQALLSGFSNLTGDEQAHLQKLSITMCIFMENELDAFKTAWKWKK